MNEVKQEGENLSTILKEVHSNVPNGRSGGYQPLPDNNWDFRLVLLYDRFIRVWGEKPLVPLSDESRILQKAAFLAGIDTAILRMIEAGETFMEIPADKVSPLKKIFRAGMEDYLICTKYPNTRRAHAVNHAFDKMRELYGKPAPKA